MTDAELQAIRERAAFGEAKRAQVDALLAEVDRLRELVTDLRSGYEVSLAQADRLRVALTVLLSALDCSAVTYTGRAGVVYSSLPMHSMAVLVARKAVAPTAPPAASSG